MKRKAAVISFVLAALVSAALAGPARRPPTRSSRPGGEPSRVRLRAGRAPRESSTPAATAGDRERPAGGRHRRAGGSPSASTTRARAPAGRARQGRRRRGRRRRAERPGRRRRTPNRTTASTRPASRTTRASASSTGCTTPASRSGASPAPTTPTSTPRRRGTSPPAARTWSSPSSTPASPTTTPTWPPTCGSTPGRWPATASTTTATATSTTGAAGTPSTRTATRSTSTATAPTWPAPSAPGAATTRPAAAPPTSPAWRGTSASCRSACSTRSAWATTSTSSRPSTTPGPTAPASPTSACRAGTSRPALQDTIERSPEHHVRGGGRQRRRQRRRGRSTYPCIFPSANIVCVAATDNRDRLASFSNWGPVSVDLAAPGVDVLSTKAYSRVFFDDFEAANSKWTFGGTPEHVGPHDGPALRRRARRHVAHRLAQRRLPDGHRQLGPHQGSEPHGLRDCTVQFHAYVQTESWFGDFVAIEASNSPNGPWVQAGTAFNGSAESDFDQRIPRGVQRRRPGLCPHPPARGRRVRHR